MIFVIRWNPSYPFQMVVHEKKGSKVKPFKQDSSNKHTDTQTDGCYQLHYLCDALWLITVWLPD